MTSGGKVMSKGGWDLVNVWSQNMRLEVGKDNKSHDKELGFFFFFNMKTLEVFMF